MEVDNMNMQQIKQALNLNRRILAVQELYQKYQDGSRTGTWIWKNHIYPTFFISHRTMRRYLGVPAKREIKQLELHLEKLQQQCEQQS